MVLTPPATRAQFWLLTIAELLFLAVACLSAWVAAGLDENPEARAMFACGAVGSACVTAIMSVFKYGERGRFRWRIVDGGLSGGFTPDEPTAPLPLRGRLRIEPRVVYQGDETLETVEAVAFHESPQFGRVELLSEMVGVEPSQQKVWLDLVLRGAALVPARGERLVLPCGWTKRDRLLLCLAFGSVFFPFGGVAIGQPALPVFLAVSLVVLAWVLTRSMASVEMRRTQEGIEWRRVLGSCALGRWKRLHPPAVLDLTRYRRVEWRTGDGGRSLRVLGGPKGLRPVDALRVTEWMREHEPVRRSLSA